LRVLSEEVSRHHKRNRKKRKAKRKLPGIGSGVCLYNGIINGWGAKKPYAGKILARINTVGNFGVRRIAALVGAMKPRRLGVKWAVFSWVSRERRAAATEGAYQGKKDKTVRPEKRRIRDILSENLEAGSIGGREEN